MVMVMVAYNEAVEPEVMSALEKCALKNYSQIIGTYGKGNSSGTHRGDDVWPGRNNILYTACGEAEAKQLLCCVEELRKEIGSEGVKAFSWKLEGAT